LTGETINGTSSSSGGSGIGSGPMTKQTESWSQDINQRNYARSQSLYSNGMYSNGSYVLDTSNLQNNPTVTVQAVIPSTIINQINVSYPARFTVELHGIVVMEVTRLSDNVMVSQTQKVYTDRKINSNTLKLETGQGNTTMLAAFQATSTSGYKVRFKLKQADVYWQGDGQDPAELSGSFVAPIPSSVKLITNANKTEIIPGGVQVVKSVTQYFKADRSGQGWLSSSGQWNHNGTISQTSDRRQKYNISPIDFDLNLLDNLDGYTYSQIMNPIDTLINLKEEDVHTKESAGVLAQEIEAVLPNAVTESEDGTKAVDHTAVTGLILNIVKQFNTKINALEEEIKKLKE